MSVPLAENVSKPPGSVALETERVHVAESHAEEDGVEVMSQLRERDVLAQRYAAADVDTTDGQDVLDLALREVVDGLVGGYPVFVEPASFGVAVENLHIVA